jgi:hypothetical protein
MCLICWVSISSILIGLLSLSEDEAEELKADEAWAGEARDFIHRCLGHNLKTQARSRQLIADELWRLGLFSAYVMNSGVEVPSGRPLAFLARGHLPFLGSVAAGC